VHCDTGLESNFSAPLSVSTARWGDVAEPFNPPDPSAQPDFNDISALVDKFRGLPAAAIKASAQLQPNVPNPIAEVNFDDISAGVNAFRGLPYPYTGPKGCSP